MTIPHTQQAYTVAQGTSPIGVVIRQDRSPTSNDTQYLLNQLWLNTDDLSLWILVNFSSTNALLQAQWEPLSHGGFGDVAFLKGNTGGNVPPDINGVINVIGDGTTITIAGNPGTNTLTASLVGGLPALETLSDDVGTIVTPSADNIQLVGHINEQSGGKFSTVVAGSHLININPMSPSRWIVDPLGFNGTHTTISGAIASASSGDTILILPGSYTENLTFNKSLSFLAINSNARRFSTSDVEILGSITVNANLNVTFTGVSFSTNGATLLQYTGNTSTFTFELCDINIESGQTGISSNQSLANTFLLNSYVAVNTNAQFLNISDGVVWIDNSTIEIGIAPDTASVISGGSINAKYTTFQNTFNMSGGAGQIHYCDFGTVATPFINANWINLTGSSGVNLFFCRFYSGTQPCISIGATGIVSSYFCVLNSSNTNVISGTGTLNYGGIIFSGSSSQFENTLTLNLAPSTPSNAAAATVWTSTGANTSPHWV